MFDFSKSKSTGIHKSFIFFTVRYSTKNSFKKNIFFGFSNCTNIFGYYFSQSLPLIAFLTFFGDSSLCLLIQWNSFSCRVLFRSAHLKLNNVYYKIRIVWNLYSLDRTKCIRPTSVSLVESAQPIKFSLLYLTNFLSKITRLELVDYFSSRLSNFSLLEREEERQKM